MPDGMAHVMNMKARYKFGNIIIEITCPVPLGKSDNIERFCADPGDKGEVISLQCVIKQAGIPEDGVYIRRADETRFYQTAEGETAVYCRPKTDRALMRTVLEIGSCRTLYISPEAGKQYFSMQEIFRHAELINILISRDIWVMHACYVKTAYGAVLFTGNSGAGKSTQGSLWERYGCGEVINGDRALVYLEDDRYKANGFVYSGSSGICKNAPSLLRAVVLVNQSEKNEIIHMKPSQAVRTVFLQSVSCPYRETELRKKLEFAERLSESIEILQLNCRPDEGAVRILEKYLQK